MLRRVKRWPTWYRPIPYLLLGLSGLLALTACDLFGLAGATTVAATPATPLTAAPTVLVAAITATSPLAPLAPTPQSVTTPSAAPPPQPSPTVEPKGSTDGINLHMVVGIERNDVLNVRNGPGASYDIVGAIPPYGFDISVLGEWQAAGKAWWAPVRYGTVTGWVNADFLAEQVGSAETSAVARALDILLAVRDRDMAALASYAHPQLGVKFSPYTYIREEDLVFSAEQLPDLLADPGLRVWGSEAGSGNPINLSFADYYTRFVYRYDYFRAQRIGLNAPVSFGSEIDNSRDLYPDAAILEYHFDGFDPAYGGLDWHSLRLILLPANGQWYLVNLNNEEWTP